MSFHYNDTIVKGSLSSTGTMTIFGHYIYIFIVVAVALAPLAMFSICAIRFCLGERDWERELLRQEHQRNVQRLVTGTSSLLRIQSLFRDTETPAI